MTHTVSTELTKIQSNYKLIIHHNNRIQIKIQYYNALIEVREFVLDDLEKYKRIYN